MGVDYSANFGIGFKIKHPQSNDKFEKEYEGDFIEFFYKEIQPLIDEKEDYRSFQVGEGCYDGTENEIYVVVNGNLSEGWNDVLRKTAFLKTFLWDLDLISLQDEADLVGGLEVY
ncbi:hypothetical protein EGI16_21750 [Chryseobacterium sp. G0240]|uniref:hypothetical protein n=1 Tax=Chryseobacterium sp. G0240 TaxID=2487066 RepID=UPI000F44D03A|nr:hypothetical protein [Chryseobacterium sp. G0240]ROH98305.1 hypothetical protein EGI16_21750 [Chryseobacterium sp. G0240]